MQVRFIMSPVHAPEMLFDVDTALSLPEVLDRVHAPEWFRDFGFIRIGGDVVPREIWEFVKLKPDAVGYCDLCVVPRNKNVLPLLLTVATVALASAVSGGLLGPASLGLLGSAFATGGTGAYLAAAAIGVGGQLLSSALSAPPKIGQQKTTERNFAQAGISINQPAILETLPVIYGRVVTSPPQLMQGFTELIDGEVWLNAVVGLEGRCLIEDIKINGIKAADVARAQIESREGNAGDTMPSVGSKLVVQRALNSQTLSNFRTVDNDTVNDQLVDQIAPDNSMPGWHVVETAGSWTEFDIRISMPGGAINTVSGDDAMVPIRLEGKLKSSPTWRNFPTIHAQDVKSGTGEVKFEIKIKRTPYPGGIHYTYSGTQWPVLELSSTTGLGQAFLYSADTYFVTTITNGDNGFLPDMTGITTSGFTITSSSQFSASWAAWKVSDRGTGIWRPTLNSLPASITFQFPTTRTVRSLSLVSSASTGPTACFAESSVDGVAWTNVQSLMPMNAEQNRTHYQIQSPVAGAYFRLTFTANDGAANQDLQISELYLHEDNAPGLLLVSGDGGAGTANLPAYYSFNNLCRATNCEVTPDGCTFFLDPADWPAGEYEFRLKRGVAVDNAQFKPFQYNYGANSANSDFFERRLVSGKHVVRVGQKRYRSDTVIESITTIDDTETAYNHEGLALITLRVPGVQVESISATFTRYGREWNGISWDAVPVPTKNPAAMYRDLLLGYANATPVHTDVIDHAALAAWYARCDAASRECNAVVQGQSVEDVLQMLASTGFASPRHSNSESITEDYDTSALPIELNLTPLNSRDVGTSIVLPKEVHCIIAEYADEADEYRVKHSYIYKAGYSAANATLFETWSLPGFTTEAAAIERATFDMMQSELRSFRYGAEVGLEAYKLKKGSVVGLTTDVMERKHSFGLIKSVEVSGGNVVSITLDNLVPWSEALIEPETPGGDTMGVAIQLTDGVTTMQKAVTETVDSYTCTFATPFADTGVVVPGLMVATGITGKEFKRCKVMNILPQDATVWSLELADERPELFA